jgi:hypothetical protein
MNATNTSCMCATNTSDPVMTGANLTSGFVNTVLERHCGQDFSAPLDGAFTDPFVLIVTASLLPVVVAGLPV